MDTLAENLNYSLSNDTFRTLVTVVGGVFAGYTLLPVPKWLEQWFIRSNFFKWIVLIIIGLTLDYPIDRTKLPRVIIVATLIVVLFQLFRSF